MGIRGGPLPSGVRRGPFPSKTRRVTGRRPRGLPVGGSPRRASEWRWLIGSQGAAPALQHPGVAGQGEEGLAGQGEEGLGERVSEGGGSAHDVAAESQAEQMRVQSVPSEAAQEERRPAPTPSEVEAATDEKRPAARAARAVPVGLEEFKRNMAKAAAAAAAAASGTPSSGSPGQHASGAMGAGGAEAGAAVVSRVYADGSRYNYASATHGAKVAASNPRDQAPRRQVLDGDKDAVPSRVPCSTPDKFLVIEL